MLSTWKVGLAQWWCSLGEVHWMHLQPNDIFNLVWVYQDMTPLKVKEGLWWNLDMFLLHVGKSTRWGSQEFWLSESLLPSFQVSSLPFPFQKLYHQKQSNLVPLRFLFCKISWLGKKKESPFPVKYYRTWNYNEDKSSIILAVISFYNFYNSARRALRLFWWTWSASAPSLPLYFVSLQSMVLRK